MKLHKDSEGKDIMVSKLTDTNLEEITSADIQVESKLFFYLKPDACEIQALEVAKSKAEEVDARFEYRSTFERKNGLSGFFFVIPDIV